MDYLTAPKQRTVSVCEIPSGPTICLPASLEQVSYEQFLASKQLVVRPVGRSVQADAINPQLFPFQRDLVAWALRKGRAALFADTGMGKTIMYCEWARLIGERVIIVAPLAVAQQTVKMARDLLNMEVRYIRDMLLVDDTCKVYITNYEMLDHIKTDQFQAVVLDESSILKNLEGKTKQKLVEVFADTPYKLCCTATPAPNDIKEIANHSEFLGVMGRAEMLSIFFRYSQSGSVKREEAWRLKKHAIKDFYRWLCSWGLAVRKPSDLGYSDEGYILPPLTVEPILVNTDYTPDGMLPGFMVGGISAVESKKVRRGTIQDRIKLVADKVNADTDQWLLWVGLNEEGDELEKLIPGSIQVTGSQSIDDKTAKLMSFADGKARVLITKSSIAGHGLNFQNCHKMCFVGIDYSWESYYQAIRRCYRYKQTRPVQVYIVTSTQEEDVLQTILRKEREATSMANELTSRVSEFVKTEAKGIEVADWTYNKAEEVSSEFTLMLGDCTERLREIPDNIVHLSVYSPPFSDLFVYSATPRDLGNSATREEFFKHYSFIIRENYRVTMPGRICAVHCQDIRAYQNRDGYIGVKDFSGDIVEAYQREGWVFWHRITINKNPQTQAVRLKDHRLLFITLKKDSTDLSGGQADYLLIFKKPGDNPIPVIPDISQEDWIQWAHPVWNGIRETDVLPVTQAKANEDEKHMCPLQLPVIERVVRLWSNKHETVLSPFAGVGSEGVVALRNDRHFIGIELKPEYYRVAQVNLRNTEKASQRQTLFGWAEAQQEIQL